MKNNDYINDLKKEALIVVNFLEKDKKRTTLVLGWLIIFFGFFNSLNFLRFSSHYFFYNNSSSSVIIILLLLSKIFFTYAGYSLLKYKKNIPTTLIISFLLYLTANFFTFFLNNILSLVWNTLIYYSIYLWIKKQKKMFVN